MADTTPSGAAGTNATAPSAVAHFPNRTRRTGTPKRAPSSPPPSGPATYSAEHCAEFLHALEADLPPTATSYLVTLGGGAKRIVQPVASNVGMVDLSDPQEVVALLSTHTLASDVLRDLAGYCARVLGSRGEDAEDCVLPMGRRDVALHATWEIDALSELVRDLCGDLGIQEIAVEDLMRLRLKVRGLTMRIEDLNGAIISVLDNDDETLRLARRVYGLSAANAQFGQVDGGES